MRLVAATRRQHYQGRQEKFLFETWTSIDETTSLFKKLSSIATPDEISNNEFELLEFFVVRLYSKTCNTKELNEARRILFSRDKKVIENIPLTKGALK